METITETKKDRRKKGLPLTTVINLFPKTYSVINKNFVSEITQSYCFN